MPFSIGLVLGLRSGFSVGVWLLFDYPNYATATFFMDSPQLES